MNADVLRIFYAMLGVTLIAGGILSIMICFDSESVYWMTPFVILLSVITTVVLITAVSSGL